MGITREHVADLHEGDVVELIDSEWPGVTIRGPVVNNAGRYWSVGSFAFTIPSDRLSLTVVKRVPRPFYINHPRSHPLPGDVVRMTDKTGRQRIVFLTAGGWLDEFHREHDLRRADHPVLLVNGENDEVVG
jgi:pimeloyl-ACP methyl ester carboxylesterase